MRAGMSATSQRKKAEEENARAIRQLLSQEENKYCFDCGQRGPTYVNMTNGTFCCMHCSGLLRGLHPPHRVKSISMSTFTSEDVERLKTLGNAVNAAIYLGLYDGKRKFEPRVEDEVRSYLVQKYEERRWYVSPSDVEQQRRLLEDAAAQRRNSLSAVSVHSQKSNQSAPANLQTNTVKPGPIDLLTGDLFDLSLSSTPVQQQQSLTPQPSDQPKQTSLLQDDWADLFTNPPASASTTHPTPSSAFPLGASSVPPALQFPMPVLPPPKSKDHLGTNFTVPTPQTPQMQQWESFTSTALPKSATVSGVPSSSANTASNTLDELFASTFGEAQPNGQKIRPPVPQVGPVAKPTSPVQNNGAKAPESWNPFLS